LLSACGIEESEHKAYAPSTRMEFLGIVCDSVKLTLEISDNRIASLEKTASGFDHSSKIIIDIPLYVTKNLSGV
jgi:hypothetical protein